MKLKYLLFLAISLGLAACSKETPSKTVTILSEQDIDGHIINSIPKTVRVSDLSLDMGWNGGSTMRAFLSFDVSNIMPSGSETLVIEKAVLKVYENNTNMLPFSGEGATRVVEAYLLDYGTLDATDFDCATIANCGVIANWGYNVLEEHALNVSDAVINYAEGNTSITSLQFRFQFTNNANVAVSSTLSSAMWRIYSGEDQGVNFNDYRPVLVISYHWEKN